MTIATYDALVGSSGTRTENDAAVEIALKAAPAQTLDERGIFLAVTADGGREVIDVTEQLRELDGRRPLRKTGRFSVTTPTAFVDYLAKHKQIATEVWGNDQRGVIRAQIDAHGTYEAGHQCHEVSLTLPFTEDWKHWTGQDGRLVDQATFAEFIEDHLPNFVQPAGAEMLELAQTFQATTKVDFASSQRVKSGETQLTYTEDTSATAGKKGQLVIPDTFDLALQVYERGPVFRVQARFRYRITGGNLTLGYRLNRIDDVRRLAFDEVVAKVEADAGVTVWHTP